jgi:hypothetical protein
LASHPGRAGGLPFSGYVLIRTVRLQDPLFSVKGLCKADLVETFLCGHVFRDWLLVPGHG